MKIVKLPSEDGSFLVFSMNGINLAVNNIVLSVKGRFLVFFAMASRGSAFFWLYLCAIFRQKVRKVNKKITVHSRFLPYFLLWLFYILLALMEELEKTALANKEDVLAYGCNEMFESTVLIKGEKKYLLFTFFFWSEKEFDLTGDKNNEVTRKRLNHSFPGKFRIAENIDDNFRELGIELFH